MTKIPDWLAARRAPAPDSDSIEWDALRTAQELFDRNRDGLMTGEAFNANVTPAIELVRLVRDRVIDECIQVISEPLTIAAPPDVISAVQDLNDLHIEALEELKGNPDAEKQESR